MLSTKHLYYQKIGRSFFAEISEIPNFAISPLVVLESHVTGSTIQLELSDTNRDADNDVVAWVYTPVNDDRITRVVILND